MEGPPLPNEIIHQIALTDIDTLDKLCALRKDRRIHDCPSMYAKLLWKKFHLKVDPGPFSDGQDALEQANMRIAQIRSLYHSETQRLKDLQSEIQTLRDLPPELGQMKVLEILDHLQLDDRDHLNINYAPDGITLMDAYLESACQEFLDDEDILFTMNLVDHLLTVGAKPSRMTTRLFVNSLLSQTQLENSTLDLASKVLDAVGPIVQQDLEDVIQDGIHHSFFAMLVSKTPQAEIEGFIRQTILLPSFPWDIFGASSLMPVFDNQVSRHLYLFLEARDEISVDPTEDAIIQYLSWKRAAPTPEAPFDVLMRWAAADCGQEEEIAVWLVDLAQRAEMERLISSKELYEITL